MGVAERAGSGLLFMIDALRHFCQIVLLKRDNGHFLKTCRPAPLFVSDIAPIVHTLLLLCSLQHTSEARRVLSHQALLRL
jgi:hypothetical protein